MKASGVGINPAAVITAITSATALTLSTPSLATGATTIIFSNIDGTALGTVAGSYVHNLNVEEMPSHQHNSQTGSSGTAGTGAASFLKSGSS